MKAQGDIEGMDFCSRCGGLFRDEYLKDQLDGSAVCGRCFSDIALRSGGTNRRWTWIKNFHLFIGILSLNLGMSILAGTIYTGISLPYHVMSELPGLYKIAAVPVFALFVCLSFGIACCIGAQFKNSVSYINRFR